jgi:hypothetical protein
MWAAHRYLFIVRNGNVWYEGNTEKLMRENNIYSDKIKVANAVGKVCDTEVWRRLVRTKGCHGGRAVHASNGHHALSIFAWRVIMLMQWQAVDMLTGSVCWFSVNVVDGEVLHIVRVSRLHMGAYLCIASNGVPPSISKRVALRVQCKLQSIHRLNNLTDWMSSSGGKTVKCCFKIEWGTVLFIK